MVRPALEVQGSGGANGRLIRLLCLFTLPDVPISYHTYRRITFLRLFPRPYEQFCYPTLRSLTVGVMEYGVMIFRPHVRGRCVYALVVVEVRFWRGPVLIFEFSEKCFHVYI